MRIKKTLSSEVRRGFSLLELLLVLTLAPIVFFALYSNFSAGLHIWSTVVRQTPEEDLHIFFYKVRRDVENMLRTDAIPFSGDSEEIVFACAIEARPELGGKRGIGQVRFYYDGSSKTINREVKDYSQVYQESPGQVTALLRNVSSFSLSYLTPAQTGDTYSWNDSWTPQAGALPAAVRLSFEAEQTLNRQERVIYIPVGGKIK